MCTKGELRDVTVLKNVEGHLLGQNSEDALYGCVFGSLDSEDTKVPTVTQHNAGLHTGKL